MGKFFGNLALTLVLLVIGVAVLFYFNRAAAPQQKILATPGVSPPDYEAVFDTVTAESLTEDLRTLTASDTRFSGSQGSEEAADYIARNLRSLGYDTIEQPFEVTVPVTEHVELLGADGNPIPGLELKPLLPNWFRTPSTPPEGITGTVYQAEQGLAREFEDVEIEGNFAMLPVGKSWQTVTAMGVSAVLYYQEPDQEMGSNWAHHVDASIDVPRFLVTGEAPQRLHGQTVTLSARINYKQVKTRNIIGFLEAPEAEEAVIVNTY